MSTLSNFFKKNRIYLAICTVFMVYTLGSFGFYYERTLQGNINNHILSGDMFGIPADLKARGVTSRYYGPGQTGWDGQFYYFIANDILAVKDTAVHVDAPPYRYQRAGLSFYVATTAALLGQDWVSPGFFFWSYFVLLLGATWAGARLFSQSEVRPSLVLIWALSVGTQITLFNALPDAAADGFLILALLALFSGRYALSVVPFALAALSRETYTLFPSLIFLTHFISSALKAYNRRPTWNAIFTEWCQWHPYYTLLLPGVIFVCWWAYLIYHFGIIPSSQAHGILGLPLVSWFDYFQSGVLGNHKLVGKSLAAYAEAGSLLCFLGTLVLSLWVSCRLLFTRHRTSSPTVQGIALTTLAFVLLYLCFGPTVIMHYTGYLKAIGVFFFLLPLLARYADVPLKLRQLGLLFLLGTLCFTSYYNLKARILDNGDGADSYTRMGEVTRTKPIACFGDYHANIQLVGITLHSGSLLADIFGRSDRMIIKVRLTNTSKHTFVSTKNVGSVHMSYHWVDQDGHVVLDGIRTAIPDPIKPGQSAVMDVVSPLPSGTGKYTLKLSPVQEGCAWFYMINDNLGPRNTIVVGG